MHQDHTIYENYNFRQEFVVLFDVGVYDSAKEVAIVLAVGVVVATSAKVLLGLVMSGPLGLLGFFI